MMKKTIFCLVLALGLTGVNPARSQLAFWNYDDADGESQIPSECDGTFDESRGGVFVPSAAEMAKRGEEFLINPDPTERNKAGYCLIAAALRGHIPSQYRVSQLYAKGIVLPQDDLSAYRWAFLASLNGHEEAAKHALLLERFLTTKEIELATASVNNMRPGITKRYQAELNDWQQRVDDKQKELDEINDEIDKILGIEKPKDKKEDKANKPKNTELAAKTQKAVPHGAIFGEEDRRKK
ncbi:MAG: sel1 repeat family protein [Alphaproteobacteria bacterium]|nr:sel1 repeat family protein [Alphaproteobacteria bacterium]